MVGFKSLIAGKRGIGSKLSLAAFLCVGLSTNSSAPVKVISAACRAIKFTVFVRLYEAKIFLIVIFARLSIPDAKRISSLNFGSFGNIIGFEILPLGD